MINLYDPNKDEVLMLNYLINHPNEVRLIKDELYFSDQLRPIYKVIESFAETSNKISLEQLKTKTDTYIDPVQLDKVMSLTCGDYEPCLETLKKNYILKQCYTKGNVEIIRKYIHEETIGGRIKAQIKKEFDSVTCDELITEIRKGDSWLDKMEIEDGKFDPFVGYRAEDIPGSDIERVDIIPDLFKSGSFEIICGPSKAGKSQLGYQLAYALQNKQSWLGYNIPEKHNVLYVDWELSPNEIRDRRYNLDRFFGMNGDSPMFIPLYRTNYTIEETVNRIKKTLKMHPEIECVFFDNYYSFCDTDANNSTEVKKNLKLLQTISDTAIIFLICHTNKTDGKAGGADDPIFATSGSNAFGAFMDEGISIVNIKDSEYKQINMKGRHINKTLSVKCRYDDSTYFYFEKLSHEEEIRFDLLNVGGKSEDELKEQYPKLSEFIGQDGKTIRQIQKEFPDENVESLREKGFYIERNKERCKEGFLAGRWYLVDPVKDRKFFQN